MAGSKQIDLLFGVQGGGTVSGASGTKILNQISSITRSKEMHNACILRFTADTSEVFKQIKLIQKRLDGLSFSISGAAEGEKIGAVISGKGKTKTASDGIDSLKSINSKTVSYAHMLSLLGQIKQQELEINNLNASASKNKAITNLDALKAHITKSYGNIINYEQGTIDKSALYEQIGDSETIERIQRLALDMQNVTAELQAANREGESLAGIIDKAAINADKLAKKLPATQATLNTYEQQASQLPDGDATKTVQAKIKAAQDSVKAINQNANENNALDTKRFIELQAVIKSIPNDIHKITAAQDKLAASVKRTTATAQGIYNSKLSTGSGAWDTQLNKAKSALNAMHDTGEKATALASYEKAVQSISAFSKNGNLLSFETIGADKIIEADQAMKALAVDIQSATLAEKNFKETHSYASVNVVEELSNIQSKVNAVAKARAEMEAMLANGKASNSSKAADIITGTKGNESDPSLLANRISYLESLQAELLSAGDASGISQEKMHAFLVGVKELGPALNATKIQLKDYLATSVNVAEELSNIQSKINAVAKARSEMEAMLANGQANDSSKAKDLIIGTKDNKSDPSLLANRISYLESLQAEFLSAGDASKISQEKMQAFLTGVKELGPALIATKAQLKDYSSVDINWRAGLNKSLDSLLKFRNGIRANLDDYPELKAKFDSLVDDLTSGKKYRDANGLARAHDDVVALQIEAEKAGVSVDKLGQALSRKLTDRVKFLIAQFATQIVSQGLRQIYQNVVAIDSAMTELRKVTQATQQEYNRFLEGAGVRAKKLGATLTDVINATADYARLGYDIADASQLADSALIYKNVGDGLQNIDQATEHLISTMQAFKVETKDSLGIVDVYNEVANNYATSAADIGEGLQRSSASMAAAGNTLEETVAIFTAAQTTLQDSDVVGRLLPTLKVTISVKLRRRTRPSKDLIDGFICMKLFVENA